MFAARNFFLTGVRSIPLTVEYLVVAGGGGGAGIGSEVAGGGGGAGGYRTSTGYAVTAATPISVTVGAASSAGGQGNDSVFGSTGSTIFIIILLIVLAVAGYLIYTNRDKIKMPSLNKRIAQF